MTGPLAAFDLERYMRQAARGAKFMIGGSGVAQANIEDLAPTTPAEWQNAWAAHPDDLMKQVHDVLAMTYGVPTDEILLTQGASEADFIALLALAGPRGRVVVEEPAYFALLEPANALACRVTRVRRKASDGFLLQVDQVRKALKPDTKLILLARPHNPTGERVTDEDLRAIAEAADNVGAFVVVDEVFAEATPEGDRPARSLHPRILSVNSLTKCMGFGPLHVGWIFAPKDVRETLWRAKMHVRPLNPSLDLAMAARALAHRRGLLERTRANRARNVAAVEEFIASNRFLKWWKPAHGTTCVVKLPSRWKDDVAFADRLRQEASVLVGPGSYVELPGWIRIGLAGDPTVLVPGLEALGTFLRGAA